MAALVALAGAALACPAAPGPAAAVDCIVVLRSGPGARGTGDLLRALDAPPRRLYRHAFPGFAAALSPRRLAALRAHPGVLGVFPDGSVRLAALPGAEAGPAARGQSLPAGVRRCGAALSPTAAIDGRDAPLDADVAVIDTGIDRRHRELNVAGSVTFRGGGEGDAHGHGTHVAGIIGARDNRRGVVGVAPGVRLWSVRVLDAGGSGSFSDLVAGLDWAADPARGIDVVNLSLGGPLGDDTPVRLAVDACVAAGRVVVAAAGNHARDTSTFVPARLPGVLAVSALADSNGEAGAGAGPFRAGRGYIEEDESFADFSNFGAGVGLIAPGVRIRSTWKGGRYRFLSGTSMAAAYVSGAAALYRVRHPGAGPAEVREALRAAGAPFSPPDDPDGVHEPALDVSGL